MLRANDLLNLKVSDVLNESDWVRKEVRLKIKKTKKATLNVPLSKKSSQSSRNTNLRGREGISYFGQLIITTRENLFPDTSIPELSRTIGEV